MLTFDSFTASRNFVHDVLRSYGAGSLSAEHWNQGLAKLHQEDDSGYASYIALGELFAAEGIWRVAAILANRALSVAERDRPERISGREAAYLRAVALRHSARRAADLAPVGPLLDQAEAAYAQDIKKRPKLKAAPCRFKAERLALFLTYHLYHIFHRSGRKGSRMSVSKNVPPLPDLVEQLEQASREIINSTEKPEVILYIERNLLVNWLMASLLWIKTEDIAPGRDVFEERYVALQKNIEQGKDKVPVSFYEEAILRVSSWYLEKTPHDKKARRRSVEEWLDLGAVENHCVMPYDLKRFEYLRELTLKSL